MEPLCDLCSMSVHAVLSVPCSLVVNCWERTDSCVFFTFPYGALGLVWHLIVSILDLCLLSYFKQWKGVVWFCLLELMLYFPFNNYSVMF